jgi:peptide/nickel transport system substrate-binding protein
MRLGSLWRNALLTAGLLALGTALLGIAGCNKSSRKNTIFRIAGMPDSIDPALSLDATLELRATCALLMNYPDKPPPDGTRLVPEVAAAYPTVSNGGKTYTFTIRPGFRFNTGEQVTPTSFAHEINRVLSPAMKSPAVQSVQDIVGAQAVLDGKATNASGVKVRGDKLIIELTGAARDFPARVSTVSFCAVPTNLPIDPEGVGAPFPGAGPYYAAEFIAGRRLVLKRNPSYGGTRPHHIDRFEVSSANPVSAVENGTAEFADVTNSADLAHLDPKYRSQLFSVPGTAIRYVVLNSSQPLFKDNVALRQAVNFAIDRPALLRQRGATTGRTTDQYLTPSMPGFVDAHIYPLDGPNVSKAKALARGHTRSGKAVLYVKDTPVDVGQAQILQGDLKAIGLAVKVRKFPGPALFQKLFTPGTQYDMTLLGWGPDYFDPYEILNVLFDGRLIGTPTNYNTAYFNSPKSNESLARASTLTGQARYDAYGKLDVDLARNEAPIAAYATEDALTFVSKRVGCRVLNPFLDLAAVCLN